MSSEHMELRIPYVAEGEGISPPAYAHKGDAALDLRAAVPGVIEPGERMLVPCGFSMALPEGFAGLVLPRSGLAARSGITVLNAPGLIDSSYRGQVMVCLLNTDKSQAFAFDEGDRIAQLFIISYQSVIFEQVDALDETERGEGGFGSSGLS